jgi:hypothetical protein
MGAEMVVGVPVEEICGGERRGGETVEGEVLAVGRRVVVVAVVQEEGKWEGEAPGAAVWREGVFVACHHAPGDAKRKREEENEEWGRE